MGQAMKAFRLLLLLLLSLASTISAHVQERNATLSFLQLHSPIDPPQNSTHSSSWHPFDDDGNPPPPFFAFEKGDIAAAWLSAADSALNDAAKQPKQVVNHVDLALFAASWH